MSRQINLYEAKTQLSRLVEEAANGETIIIAKDGRAMAKLVPLSAGTQRPRELGQLASRSRDVDWAQWWRDWKAADQEIEAEFEMSARRLLPVRRRKKRP